MKNSSLQPYYWILVSGFTFSWMATFAPLAGRAFGWQAVTIIRCVIPLAIVGIWAKCDGVKLVVWGPPLLWMRSLAGSCSLVGTFYAFHILPLTDIYTIANTFPIFVALLSWPMLGRFPPLPVWIAIFSSVLGVAIIQGPDLQAGNYSALIVVGVSLSTALAMMGLNRLRAIDPRAIVFHFSLTALGFAILCLAIFPYEPVQEPVQIGHVLELLGVGLTATLGQLFLTKAFTTGDAARLSVANLSQFVFVLILDILVLKNPLDPHKLWGIPLIIVPTLWLMAHPSKEPEPKEPSEERANAPLLIAGATATEK